MLELSKLSISFGGVRVINNLTMHIAQGERLVVLGPNGAGKTTLLRLIAGDIMPDQGNIHLDGQDITRLSQDARARAGLGRGFQKNNLFADFSLRENLILAAITRTGKTGAGRDPLYNQGLNRKAEAIAAQTGLDNIDLSVAKADYGTCRRLDLALALIGISRLILLDEPSSGIGPGGAAQIHSLIAGLSRDLTLLVIEHDLDLAFAIADRVAVMNQGQIIFTGSPDAARPVLKTLYDNA
ncbi:MAG: ABC transporter ATP-binding protein [Paracoccus sp. (in: a-proteobacteria)]